MLRAACCQQDNGAEISTQLHNIWHTNEIMIGNIQRLLDFSDEIASLSGLVVRIAEFNEVLDDLQTAAPTAGAAVAAACASGSGGGGGGGGGGGAIEFKGVDLVTPGGECLGKQLSVAITPGKGLVRQRPSLARCFLRSALF
eukprot:SAG22_NODE_5101_length_1086_cov_1.165147_2_plen_142_part_00